VCEFVGTNDCTRKFVGACGCVRVWVHVNVCVWVHVSECVSLLAQMTVRAKRGNVD
jgi:hypothetical protein